jgi:hypothetical protein
MVKSADASSTKSSAILSKAASLWKSVQKGAKAISRPFKKLKKSIASLTCSRSPASDAASDREDDDIIDRSNIDNRSSDSDSDPELTPEKQLGI